MDRKRKQYAPEFRARMVDLVRAGRSPAALAREFEPTAQAIGRWVRDAERAGTSRPTKSMTADERSELQQLRRGNARLREEREILKKAAAWFARETGTIPPESSNS